MSIRNNLSAAVVLLLLSSAASADGINGGGRSVDMTPYAKISDIPQPADTAPVTDATAAAIGTSPRYQRQDSIRPARYRSGTCTIAGGAGACTITWSTPFGITPNALGDPSALNTSPATTQYNCNWTALSATQGSVVCRSSVLGIAVLGTILSFLSNGVVVTGNAIQPL